MTRTEYRMLSILRPGDMLRFVMELGADRRVSVRIEGAHADSGDGFLNERLSLVLEELRSEGFAFNPPKAVARRRTKSPSLPTGKGAKQWVEIRPIATCMPVAAGGLGFDSNPVLVETRFLRAPDFPPTLEGDVAVPLADLIRRIPGLVHFEIEFTRVEIPAEAAVLIDGLLFRLANSRKAIEAVGQTMKTVDAFLSLWITRRTGWKIVLRAMFPRSGRLPIAALEMVGRDFYKSECEVSTRSHEGKETVDTLDLLDCIPSGWPLPSLLPSPSKLDAVSADSFHNLSLPGLPKSGFVIGMADGTKVRLPNASRDRHTYIAGATGTGKSTLLARMIREDIRAGEGVILLDPHGDLHAETLDSVPQARRKDLLVIDPLHEDICPGMNILDLPFDALRKRHAELLIGELITSFKSMWDTPEAFGPMFELYFRNALTLLIMQSGVARSLGDFPLLFAEKSFRSQLIETCTDSATKTFWRSIAERTGGEASLENIAPYIICKVSPLIQGAFLSSILTQPKDDLRLAERINQAPIVLINLNKGLLGVHESRILGVILMVQIMSAGLKRSVIPRQDRHPVNVYVDEFQDFVSDNMASMLSEARKFGLRLTLANQTLAQLRANRGRQDLLETVLGNVGNLIFFRLGVPDAERLTSFLEPFSRQDIQDLPNFHALVRLLTPEGPIRPLIMKTLKS